MDEDIAHICYQPDPVCAHLAMCLMDSTWNYSELSGCDPKFWTEAATELFSSGVCHPSKGDVGEVATALYFLFCGDKARQRLDSNYMHFSINLTSFVEQLLQNRNMGSKVKAPTRLSNSRSYCTVNFIQITRQYFRVPLKDLCSQQTLELMYNSAFALYLETNEEAFDILAPIRCIDVEGKTSFIPFLVTVKSQRGFSNSNVQNAFVQMRKITCENEIKHGFCLLVLLDAKNNPLENDTELDLSDATTDMTNEIMYKAIAIQKDPFGITKLVQNTRGVADNPLSDVYISHMMISSLPDTVWEGNFSGYRKSDLDYAQRVSKPGSKIKKKTKKS
jgi:hypothetical protein